MAEIEDNITRSEDIQDIIGRVPSWIVRAGSITVFVFFCFLILIGWLFQYPDIVNGSITITCQNPPADLVSRSSGRVRFLIAENSQISEGDYVAVIENTAHWEEILQLKQNLTAYKDISQDILGHLDDSLFVDFLNLGEVQEDFNRFKLAYDENKLFYQIKFNTEKVKGYHNQLQHHEKQLLLTATKKKTLEREKQIFKRQYETDQKLFKAHTISQLDLDKSESQLNQSSSNLHKLEDEDITNRKTIDEIKSKINELLIEDKDQMSKLAFNLKQSFKELNTSFVNWEKKYVLVAPISGKITFYKYWNDNQNIKEGSDVAHIVTDAKSVFGKLYTKGHKMGKVKVGQRVRIKLDNYPSSEYGVVFGKIESISSVNKDNTYLANVVLPDGLVTNYHQKIIYNHDMVGSAEIITEKLSLLERFFHQSRKIYTNNY